jgi:hypothetical protein
MTLAIPNKIFFPLLLAVAAWGWVSLPTIDHPLGSDWGHYFTAAEYIWMPTDSLAYPDFRKPWFGWILGGLGSWVGYLDAAQWLGRVSMVAMVGSAALLGTALANRWAGLASAAVVVMMPLVMDGALWVNHYPLLGAAVGAGIALSASAARWPGLAWVVSAGLVSGAAMALDARGTIAVVVASLLVVLGSVDLGLRRTGLRVLLFASMVAAIWAHDGWLQDSFNVPQLEFAQQLQVQRKGTLEQIQQGIFDDSKLEDACDGVAVQAFSVDATWTSCGDALRNSSLARLQKLALLPSGWTLWMVLLALLPATGWSRRGRMRSVCISAVVFGGPALSVWAGMAWVTYFDRYVLPFSVLMAALVPIGMSRLSGLLGLSLGRFSKLMPLAAALGALCWALVQWPSLGGRDLDAPERVRSSEYHAGALARWVQDETSPDDHVIDCAGLAIDSLLLPIRTNYVRFPPGDEQCVALLSKPGKSNGRTFLITMHRDIPPQYRPTDLPFNAAAVAALGWIEVGQGLPIEGYRVWEMK